MNRYTFMLASFLWSFFFCIANGASIELPITKTVRLYVVHAGGGFLCKETNERAIIAGKNDSKVGKMTIIPDGNGYYSIVAQDGKGFLQLEGKWDAFFRDANYSSDNAKYSIESAGGDYVKFKCKANGKYLGTNGTPAGQYVFSDKDGNSPLHKWILSEDKESVHETDSVSYVINPYAKKQTIEGWGVSLCWWANMCGKWDDENIDVILDWLVSPEGLNYNIFRYNIGGGDDPENKNCDPHHMGAPGGKGLRAEMEGFKDSTNGEYIWTRDAAQRKIMLKIREKRPDAIFEAFSNSCPYYMTYSGCCAGNVNGAKDNLKPEYYEEFAHYLVDVCKHYKDEYGLEFRTLEPFNESLTGYWHCNGGQEGCHFDLDSQIKFLKILSPILKESGLNTVISASDESVLTKSVETLEGYRKAGIMDLVGQWNTHSYKGTITDRARIKTLSEDSGKRLWLSETGNGGSGISGNLAMAQRLMNDVNYLMPVAWVDWQYTEGDDQWSLVRSNFATQTYEKVKNYYVRQQITRFIKIGYTILSVSNEQVLAARNPAGDSLVVVAMNTDVKPVSHNIDLAFYSSVGSNITSYITSETKSLEANSDFLLENDRLKFTLPGLSIATFIIPVTENSDITSLPEDGASYMILPRTAHGMALQTNRDGKIVVEKAEISEDQTWRLAKTAEGWTFTNGNGKIITRYGKDYDLMFSIYGADGQNYNIESVDAPYCKIMTPDGTEAFDLSGGQSVAGTKVGIYKYNDDLMDVTRQWLLMRLPERQDIPDGIGGISEDKSDDVFVVENGVLHVKPECSGMVSVFSASGAKMADVRVEGGAEIPLADGVYVVCYKGDGRTCSRVIFVD